PQGVRRWVEITPRTEGGVRAHVGSPNGAVVASGHLGSWELLLGFPSVFADVTHVAFVAQAIMHPAVDRFLATVRGSGGGSTVLSHGGARALDRHVKGGGTAALLVDRNVRPGRGGIWVPFLGLEACTSPLPAWLARRNDVPLRMVFCLPGRGGRYALTLGEELALGVRSEDAEADILEITRRINETLERVIRRHPEAWNWTLKRFKNRPARDLAAYPAYSLWEPPPSRLRRRATPPRRAAGGASPGSVTS
ncbi:MAG: lysophospholipid acyltransferase family protein, partial [Planctomycetota bacterium]